MSNNQGQKPNKQGPQKRQSQEDYRKQALKRADERSMKARERGAHVIIPSCPEMTAMTQMLEQCNDLYGQLKASSGPFSIIRESRSNALQQDMLSICFALCETSERIAKELPGRVRFFTPRTMEAAYKRYKQDKAKLAETAEKTADTPEQQTATVAEPESKEPVKKTTRKRTPAKSAAEKPATKKSEEKVAATA